MSKLINISQVSRILNLVDPSSKKPRNHILRYWEKEFKQIKPKILNGNRRYYDKSNVDLLKKIKFLLKDQGMTIEGVKKILNLGYSNDLDEFSNKTIRLNNLKNNIDNISQIIKDLKKLK